VVKKLAAKQYRFLAGVPETAIRTQKISVIEKELERFLIKKRCGGVPSRPAQCRFGHRVLLAKYNEITNIRIISRCKTADFPVENLKEELVYV